MADTELFTGGPVHGGITLELCYNSGHISNPFSPSFIPNARNSLPPFIQCGQELIIKTFWSQGEIGLIKNVGLQQYDINSSHYWGRVEGIYVLPRISIWQSNLQKIVCDLQRKWSKSIIDRILVGLQIESTLLITLKKVIRVILLSKVNKCYRKIAYIWSQTPWDSQSP